MELLVILKNPVLALGSRTVRMLMELGRIALFFSNGFILKYIKLSPGGSDVILKPGDTIIETESALDVEEIISKYAFGGV